MKSRLLVAILILNIYLILTDAQNIVIDGENPYTAEGGKNVVITCKVVSGIAQNEDPRLEWYDQRGNKVLDSGRITVLSITNIQLKLLINTVEEDDAGTYNCTGNINGKLESAHVVIKTKMPLVVTEDQAPRTQYFAEGDNAQVKCAPQGNVQISWKDRAGNTISSTDNRYIIQQGYMEIPTINRTDDGTYSCLVFSDEEFMNIRISVIVTVPPKIVKPPSDQSIAVGEAARFECVATAKPEPVYFWFKDGGGVELGGERYDIDKNTGVFIIKSVIKDDAGMYKCVARSRDSQDQHSAQLIALVPPTIVRLDNATADEGTQGVITCTAYGEPIPTIKWQKKGSDLEFAEGSQQDNSNIIVSHKKRQETMENIGTLTITNLKSNDAGFYMCKAENEAKPVEKEVYLTVQYKPNFSKVKQDVIYSWGGQNTPIQCIASSVPTANITWFRGEQQINAGDQYYSIQQTTIGEDTTSVLRVDVDFSNTNVVFGSYVCKAGNRIGENNRTFTLQKADKPSSPGVSLSEATPTSVSIQVTVPTVLNGPQVSAIEVEVPGKAVISQGVQGSGTKVNMVLSDLTPSTDYNIKVYAVNDVDKSNPNSIPVRTPEPRKPYPIVILANPTGQLPTQFNLHWKEPNNGGFPVTNIYVRYREVTVYPNKTADNKYQRKDHVTGWYQAPTPPDGPGSTSYMLKNLAPSKYYEVEVTAKNTKGTSDPEAFIFHTSREHITTVDSVTKEAPPNKKSQDITDNSIPLGLIIAIIIIVVIILFIVIDVTCYYKRQCGVFMCIKEKVGRSGSMETRSKEKIIEEGDADGKPSDNKKTVNKNGLKCATDDKNIDGSKKVVNGKDASSKTEVTKKSPETSNKEIKALENSTTGVKTAAPEQKQSEKQTKDEKPSNDANQNNTTNNDRLKNDKTQKEEKSNDVARKNETIAEGDKIKADTSKSNTEATLSKPERKSETNIDEKKSAKKKLEFKDEPKVDKKVPLLSDNKDQEGTDADAEPAEEPVQSEEKEPEDKEEKSETPTKDVEEAEEATTEDKEKPETPKEEVKEVTEESKE